jgi:hypothetical protein
VLELLLLYLLLWPLLIHKTMGPHVPFVRRDVWVLYTSNKAKFTYKKKIVIYTSIKGNVTNYGFPVYIYAMDDILSCLSYLLLGFLVFV